MCTVTGTLKIKGEVQTFGSNGFKKCEIIVNTGGDYAQEIPIAFTQQKSDLPDPYEEGEEIKVSCNIKGREHNGRYYPTIEGWKIERLGAAPAPKQALPNEPIEPTAADLKQVEQKKTEDDLPF